MYLLLTSAPGWIACIDRQPGCCSARNSSYSAVRQCIAIEVLSFPWYATGVPIQIAEDSQQFAAMTAENDVEMTAERLA